jgi:hypothetical protein
LFSNAPELHWLLPRPGHGPHVDQNTANQERELREVAGRIGWEITKV